MSGSVRQFETRISSPNEGGMRRKDVDVKLVLVHPKTSGSGAYCKSTLVAATWSASCFCNKSAALVVSLSHDAPFQS
jgi:hypothetical protein